ncbi:MAG TPA: MMPL family transporter [Acidimicrobiales bacterium]|nr:MMPL family transporter [Acidimicrobiales bacterium]
MHAWARMVARRRYLVVGIWAFVVASGLLANHWLPPLLTTSLEVPGTSSAQANTILSGDFGENVEGTFTVVLRRANASLRAADERLLSRAAGALPQGHASSVQYAPGIAYANVSSSLNLQAAASRTLALRRTMAPRGGLVTGPPAIQHDVSVVLAADLRTGELIAVLAALAVLLVSLGWSIAVLLPFVTALAASASTLGAVFLAAHGILMVLYVPDVVELIGLGLAIDYGLLMVHRYREELHRHAGAPDAGTEAVVATMCTAGRTVMASGAAVGAGLVVLAVVPVPFVRSLGVAGCLVPVFSVAAALSLLPACLAIAGQRVTSRRSRAGTEAAGQFWERAARLVVERPVVPAICSLALLSAAATPAAWLALTPASTTAIPPRMPSSEALALLRASIGPGVITPLEIVVDGGGPGAALRPGIGSAVSRLADELVSQPQVFVVAIGDRGQYISGEGRYRRIVVVPRQDFGSPPTMALVKRLDRVLVARAHFPSSARVFVGGAPAQGVDFLDSVYGALPWLVLGASLIAYLILARTWRSALLPLLSLALDALSIAAGFGAMVVLFRFGAGRALFGLYHVSQVEGWAPVFILAVLFGLSMDYQMFIVARVREAVDAGMTGRRAVQAGLASTGKVVSAAGAVMVAALCGLAASHIAGMQELGVGLASGVALDATVVRFVLLPALMSLSGRWNWWFPRPLASALHMPLSQ